MGNNDVNSQVLVAHSCPSNSSRQSKDRSRNTIYVSPVGNSLYVFAQLHSGLPCLRSWGKYIFQRHKKPVVVKNINLLPYPTKNIFGIHLIHLLQSNEKLFSHYVQLSLPGCENTNSVIFLLSISAPGALCEPIHQTPKVDKTSTSEKFKQSARSQKPPRAKISAAGVSLVSQISSIAKFLPQRSSSRLVIVGTRTASLHYVF